LLTLLDKLFAVLAMLTAIQPLLKGVMSSSSHLSWPRLLAMLAGGVASFTWTVGLLALSSAVCWAWRRSWRSGARTA
jgi:hypothetical protein